MEIHPFDHKKHSAQTGLLILTLMILVFCSGIALAQTPSWCPAGAQCAQSYQSACDNLRHFDSIAIDGDSSNSMCDISALSIAIDHPGDYRFCYTVFGNATKDHHDGVNVWVGGLPSFPYIDLQILRPNAVYEWPSSTGVSGCQSVYVDQPFVATLQFAFQNTGTDDHPSELWGGRAPKMDSPSWFTVEPLD